jgi:hypothetical protein
MSEVYRARDTKLHRDVVLKILPDDFASDPDRLARCTPRTWKSNALFTNGFGAGRARNSADCLGRHST